MSPKEQKISILLVEDNALDAKRIGKLLSSSKRHLANVEIATDLKTAREKLDSNQFNLIILDLNLPDSEGIKTVIKIRNHKPHIPIIVLTGYNDELLAAQSLDEGAQDYLPKESINTEILWKSILYSIRRSNAEDRLNFREANLVALLENTTDAIWSVDTEGLLLTGNTSYEVLFQSIYSAIPEVGESIYSTMPEQEQKVWFVINNKAEVGKRFTFERSYKIGKALRHFEISVNPIISNKLFKGISYFCKDITERRSYEESVQNSERKYRTLVETMDEGMLYVDNDDKIQYVNRRFCEMSGYDRSALLTDFSISKLFGPKEKAYSKERKRMRDTGKSIPFEIQVIRKDKKKIWVLTVGSYLLDNSGKISGYIAIMTDITERKKSADEILKSEAKYRFLVENMNEGLLLLDEKYKIVFANNTACTLLSYSDDELKNVNAADLLVPDSQQRDKMLETLIGSGEFHREKFEANIARKNGELFWALGHGIPLFDEKKKYIGSMVTLNDISDLKLTEEKLRSTNKELNTFIYRASHDLKGPLTSILGLLILANMEIADAESLKYFDLIGQGSARLERILADLIYAIRLREDPVENVKIDFKQLLTEAQDQIKNMDGFEKVEKQIIIDIDERFYCDKSTLLAVVKNIIDNSIRYRNRSINDPFVKVSLSIKGNNLLIVVEDNGIGIDEKVQSTVFEMFYKGSDYSKGSGLGLYIVRNALEKLKGNLSLKSEKDGGTKIYIDIPNAIED